MPENISDRIALLQEAHRLRMEEAEIRQKEALHRAEKRESSRISEKQIEQDGSLELARFHANQAPTTAAIAVTESFGIALSRQGEIYTNALTDILRTKVENAERRKESFLGIVGQIVQTHLAHDEAERQRQHEREIVLLQATIAERATNQARRGDLEKASLDAALDMAKSILGANITASSDTRSAILKMMEQDLERSHLSEMQKRQFQHEVNKMVIESYLHRINVTHAEKVSLYSWFTKREEEEKDAHLNDETLEKWFHEFEKYDKSHGL